MGRKRDSWSTKFGIVLAAAGGAVGLGNFLRFPGVAAQNGGGAFMIPYLLSFLFLALPLCWIEWALGRYGGKWGQGSAPGVFDRITAKRRPHAKYLGALGLAVSLGIFFYYVVVESWSFAYTIFAATGKYGGLSSPAEMQEFFRSFVTGEGDFFRSKMVLYGAFLVAFTANILVLAGGVSRGIERFCRISMPLLFILAGALVIRVVTLGAPICPDWNVDNAFGFLWNPDFEMLRDPKVWLAAAGQVFFSTSVGISALMAYAAYLKRKDDVLLASTTSCFLNEFAEVVLGASIVVPAAFLFFGPSGTREAVAGGVFGLAYETTPLLFGHMPAGVVVGTAFFLLLSIAGVTSSISVLQPSMAFFEEEFGWTRRRSVMVIASITFAVAHLVIFGKGVLGEMDFWFSEFGLPVFALIETLMCLRYLGPGRAWREVTRGAKISVPGFCRHIACFVSPILLTCVLVGWFFTDGWRKIAMGSFVDGTWNWAYPVEQLPWIIVTRIVCLAVPLGYMALIRKAWRKNSC